MDEIIWIAIGIFIVAGLFKKTLKITKFIIIAALLLAIYKYVLPMF